jgi:hypothetical protein
MDIPIELFLGFIGVSIALAIFGFLRNPQIPATIVMGGMFLLVISVATTNIIMGFSISDNMPTETIYNVITNTGNANIFSPNSPIRGEYPTASNSMLIGDRFDCMTVPIAKTGNPPANVFVKAGVFDATGNLVQQFGNDLNVTNITSGFFFYDFCLPLGQYYTVGSLPALVERIGVEYRSGDSSNFITTRIDANNPYDSTITVLSTFNSGTGLWTQTSTSDFDMILTLRGTSAETQNVNYEFTELPKTLFALIGVMIMLIGGLMVMRD